MKTKDKVKAIKDLQSKKRSKPVTFQSFKPLQDENKKLKEDNERLYNALKCLTEEMSKKSHAAGNPYFYDSYKPAKEALTLHEAI